MKRIPLLLLLMCGCSSEYWNAPAPSPDDGPVRLEFGGTKAGAGDADLTEFHYLTYDYALGSWSGELGGRAVRESAGSPTFLPSDATRVYWPEGRTYSFYAAGYGDDASVTEQDVEFGTSMILYNSGTSAVLTIKNVRHNVDWLAAKLVRQGKIYGIPLKFNHICARISKLTFDLSAYRKWIEERELDIADVELMFFTITDADQQTFIYSNENGKLFQRESADYTMADAHSLEGGRMLGLYSNGSSSAVSFYAFPGVHSLRARVRTVDAHGNQVVDDRALSGTVTLPMGVDCELKIKIDPVDRALGVFVSNAIAPWENGGAGTVSE
jgi:hypothetical protein